MGATVSFTSAPAPRRGNYFFASLSFAGGNRYDPAGKEGLADFVAGLLTKGAGYVSLVASPTRARAVFESLRARDIPDERLRRLKAPAGLDLGAVAPEEIAVSILAEIVERRRGAPAPVAAATAPAAPTTARDPVCGMTVTIATARHRSEGSAGPVYFCCGGCKHRYDLEPDRYPSVRSV
jgi:xanthine dehydrogenase accessory factor